MIPASEEWIAECTRRAGARPVDLLEVLLLDAAGSAAPIRRWTGYGDLTWDSKTWNGSGDLIAIAGLPSGVDSEQHATSLTFAADATLMAMAQTHRTQGRLCQIWRGWLTESGSIVAPVMIGAYLIDDISFEMNGPASTMKVALRDRLAELDRPRMLRWTPEQQKLIDDTDRGFDQVSQMDHVEIDFGRGYWQKKMLRAD